MNKDLIAKILANENITVVQKVAKTASFDVKNRILTLPIFKEISNDVLDLFIGHEVGHSLYTTTEFWADELKEIPHFQGYINVLEDVRIEKLIKRKYPGLRKNFRLGYQQLRKDDFFGTSNADLDTMLLIDKINLFYKAGFDCGVKFTKEEANLVKKAEYTNTVQDVIDLAKEIYEFSKQELQEKLDKAEEIEDEIDPDSDTYYEQTIEEDEDEEQNDGEDTEVKVKSAGRSAEDYLESTTESASSRKIEEYSEQGTTYAYYTIPKNIDPLIYFTYKDTIVQMQENDLMHYMNDDTFYCLSRYGYKFKTKEEKSEYLELFNRESKNIVSYLNKEFEMRKSATLYKRTQQAKRGSLDTRKLYQFKLNDDIFKRINIVPEGKNHGMIMLLDWSASMADTMASTLEQVVNLSMFCRSAKIPFSVLALSTEMKPAWSLQPEEHKRWETNLKNAEAKLNEFEINPYTDLTLFELFSSKMTNKEFTHVATKCITGEIFYNSKFRLGGTPLNEALIYMNTYIPKFKSKYNVEKLTFMTLTDGESAGLRSKYGTSLSGKEKWSLDETTNERLKTIIKIRDEVTKKTYGMGWGNDQTKTLLTILKDRYDITTLGFYISKNGTHSIYNAWATNSSNGRSEFWPQKEKFMNLIKTDGYLSIKNSGRDELFIIPEKNVKIKYNEDLEVDSSFSSSKVATQLKKMFLGKKKSRVLLTRFISWVA